MLSHFAQTIFERTYQMTPLETWEGCANRVASFICSDNLSLEDRMRRMITAREFMPGGRYLYSAGRPYAPQVSNCFLFRCEDSAKAWGDLFSQVTVASSKGGGCGVEYSSVRERDAIINGYGGLASGPVSVMNMVNEIGRYMKSGAQRRSALWAGLNWQHPDIHEFITAKNWSPLLHQMKAQDPDFPAPLDQTNISVGLDDAFFEQIQHGNSVWDLYFEVIAQAMRTGEPGFSINLGDKSGFDLRNPCTEVDSDTHGDVCNLGSANLSRIRDLDHLEEVVWHGTQFLYRGTVLGWLPASLFQNVRNANRRIGLGIMGLHEWCIQRGLPYGPSDELAKWLAVWEEVSDAAALDAAKHFGLPEPVGRRAVAPTGTIGILAETTTGIEPIPTVAYKRRFHTHEGWKYQFVVDPTAQRALESGVAAEDIEDANTLAFDLERRLSMQAFVQSYTDQAISSTINLPKFGTPGNDDPGKTADALLKYLPQLRGITMYPDGARSGQPIEAVALEEAMANSDRVFEVAEDQCQSGVCGI